MVIIYLVIVKEKVHLIATDLQDNYLPIVNSENRSSHERYLKNPQKNTFYFSPISANDILTAIGDCKSKSSLNFARTI